MGNRHSQSQTLLKSLQVGTFPGSSLAILKCQDGKDGKDPEIPLLRLHSSIVTGRMRGCIMHKRIWNLATAISCVVEKNWKGPK